ncbi:MAG: NAD-glutamate dehydrogenase [Oceanospirillaceae bacterium]|nr:NAD-glutamate dehydrogenase [Oceanospirillaceae bacterium]
MTDDRERQLSSLYAELRSRQPSSRSAQLVEFACRFYASASQTDLQEWRLDDLYGATVACWQFLQEYQGGEAKVRVFNPTFEEHGWQSPHTVVALLNDDLPFIVDSVRMLLDREGLSIHAIHNAVLAVRRDEQHRLQRLFALESRARKLQREALVVLEVDRHTDERQLRRLERCLGALMVDIRTVVDDFSVMLDCAEHQHQQLRHAPAGDGTAEIREAADFVHWLKRHFTFLGCQRYRLVKESDQTRLEPVPGHAFGMFRDSDRWRLHDDGVYRVPTPESGLLTISKAMMPSQIHRAGFPDIIAIRQHDARGELCGEVRFLGLYTSTVYIQSARRIPLVRRKVDAVLQQSGLLPHGHDWKTLLQILETYPRDDLFQIEPQELYRTAIAVLQIHERRQIRVFIRRDVWGRFFSCLVYSPRDIYSTEYRHKVQAVLLRELGCVRSDFNTRFSESVLARTQFLLRPESGAVTEAYDVEAIERAVRQAARSWTDDLFDALVDALGEEGGTAAFNRFGKGFAAGYRADFRARSAVVDVQHMMQLEEARPLTLSFYRDLEGEDEALSLKLFHLHRSLPLSDVLPVLENLGLRVINERPYEVSLDDDAIWIHDFNLRFVGCQLVSLPELQDNFKEAFLSIWEGRADNDDFNRLVLAAHLNSREVAMLRAYAAYLKQLNYNIGAEAISATLCHQVELCTLLVQLFHARFEPGRSLGARETRLIQAVEEALEQVPSLTEDRVLRQYLALIRATKRVNFYPLDGVHKPYLALKLAPREIPDVPRPRPLYEIFVFSPRVEGVHLRVGKVARGGLRWSDRPEDYRTEVLGLVKAQQVKNAVIVPVGAKGGFVAKRLREGMDRDQRLAEGIVCYRQFVSGLLDLTDNLVEGLPVSPPQVRCHDEADSYLVVAADKGTAAFSDIANEIAVAYGFWLGDAFASGGSQGYDHKKMGITARGAWVSVERHFREMGLNIAQQSIRVLGIGDMSGDVFGNGMLLSRNLKLVAAFNHQHIFIDPDPDPEASFLERQRLFALPRSSWLDYDSSLISKGGGVFDRAAKSVTLSPELQAMIAMEQPRMTPSELIAALLRADVDLLWNGGIGTYVKASSETHLEVGDKANDAVRVDARELRCRVVGEGGNLGLTQRARVEYALAGGRLNTDFIDNVAGVDCSDHEVNIKILLNELVAAGDLTVKQRNRLLRDMTAEVAAKVLQNNYRQVQSISLMEVRSAESMAEFRRFITHLENSHRLDRKLEYLPDDETLVERHSAGQGLTRPELSLLVSYSKSELQERLLDSSVPDEPFLQPELETAFPERLVRRFGSSLHRLHRLRREIVATQLANHLVNLMGVNFVERLQASTGADIETIARAYVLVRKLYDLENLWRQIEALDHQVSGDTQIVMMHDLQHLARRATRWFVRNRRGTLDCASEAEAFGSQVMRTATKLGDLMVGQPREAWESAHARYVEAGVPARLASLVAATRSLYSILGMSEVAAERKQKMGRVVRAYYALGQELELHWFSDLLEDLSVENYWQALAREAFRDDLDWQHRALVSSLLAGARPGQPMAQLIADWLDRNRAQVERWRYLLTELRSAERSEYSMYTVAIRELFDLARNSSYSGG